MKKILVPVDFSENTENTCLYALEIAKKFNSEIRLFHSYFDQIIVSDSSFPTGVDTDTMMNEQLLRDIEVRAKADIQELQAWLLNKIKKEELHHIKVVYTIEGGEPETEIVEISKEHNPDIIIVGSSGKGKTGFLMGSVSRKIMTRSLVPVLTVPKDYTYKGIRRVTYLTDFKGDDFKMLNNLFSLLKDFNINIICVHLNLYDSKREDNQENMRQIMDQFKDEITGGKLSCKLIDSKEIDEGIEQMVQEHEIDLIAFLSHKRNLFQSLFKHSVTKKDLYQASIPLLAFHQDS